MDAGAAPSFTPAWAARGPAGEAHGIAGATHGPAGEAHGPAGEAQRPPAGAVRYLPIAAAAIAFAGYATTAARTITWWDGGSYPLAAVTLGIPGAPGSLLLVVLGWLASRVTLIHPVAFQLNLLAALIVATLVGVLSGLGARLATPEDRAPGLAEHAAGAFAALTFGFAFTPWTYATQFTPYGLSALWTGLILAAALAWWRRREGASGAAQLFVLFLLFGLDLSVHRTNALSLPAALIWIALRTPASGHRLRDAAIGAAGFALGLAFHLLLIPMAARHPAYMIEDTSTLAGLWSYVSIGQKGGNFLIGLYPRTADFLHVQVADYVGFLRQNLSPGSFLPAILAGIGWLTIARTHPRRATGLLVFFLCAGPGAVLYFNLPKNYMRPIDRHYLPSLVFLAPWMAVGAAAVLQWARRRPGVVMGALTALVLALVPAAQWRRNHRVCDLSRVRFADTYTRDVLATLPANAILLTNGDNDSFPPWYLQQAEHLRTDVSVINIPLMNTGNYVRQLRREPGLARLLEGEPMAEVYGPVEVGDSTVAVPVDPHADLGLPRGALPESIRIHVTGTLYGSDRAALDIVRLVRWRRPVYLATTVSPDNLPWLHPYARLDGLAFRVVPTLDPAVQDLGRWRTNLFERVTYAGVADTTVRMDKDSRAMCGNYLAALVQLASAEVSAGRIEDARATLHLIDTRVPPARVGWDESMMAQLRAQIEPGHR